MSEAYCECGCGGLSPLAMRDEPRRGYVKGQPLRFIRGHSLKQKSIRRSPVEIVNGGKQCLNCEEWRPMSDYALQKSGLGGRTSRCRSCRKLQQRVRTPESILRSALRKFGLSIEDYKRMLADQGGVCAICRQPEKSKINGKVRRLSVDHCHTAGHVRGVLCNDCNVGLSRFNDDPGRLIRAVAYLGVDKLDAETMAALGRVLVA